MKRTVLVMVLVLLCCSTVFSDWYLGGDLFYNRFSRIHDDVNYNISLTIGFIVNSKFDYGLNLLFNNIPPSNNFIQNEYSTGGYGVFIRYSFFDINKFSVLGYFGLDFIGSSWFGHGGYNHVFSQNLNIGPVFQYKLSDNIYLYSNTSLGSIYRSKVSNDRDEWTEFGINLNTSDISFSLSDVSLGFIVLFGSSGSRYREPGQRRDKTARSGNEQGDNRRENREDVPVPQLGEATVIQQALNRMPAIPIAGNNLQFTFGGDAWIAKLNGRDFLGGSFISEDTEEGSILTLRQTHIYPPRDIPGIRWVRTPGPEIVLEYKAGPPASLRQYSGN